MLQFGHQKLGSKIPDIAIAFAFNETQPTHGDIDRAQPVHILSTCKFVGFQTTHVNVGHLKSGTNILVRLAPKRSKMRNKCK